MDAEKKSAREWVELLRENPERADECDTWGEFDAYDLEWMGLCRLEGQKPKNPNPKWGRAENNGDARQKWRKIRTPLLKRLERADAGKQGGAIQALVLNWSHNLPRCRFRHFTGRDWRDFFLVFKTKDIPSWVRDSLVVEKCRWELLDGDDWAKLLSMKSNTVDLLLNNWLYSKFCDWKKLSDDDWRYLLSYRPELIEKFESRTGRRYKDLVVVGR